MSDIYYQPRRTQYKSQYVPMPLDFMQKSLQVKQAGYDEYATKLDELEALKFNALQGGADQKYIEKIEKDIDDFVENSLNKDLGSSQYAREFKKFRNAIAKDKNIEIIENEYAKDQKVKELLNKYRESGDPNKMAEAMFWEHNKSVADYIAGPGYAGNFRTAGIESVTPGMDVRKATEDVFNHVGMDALNDIATTGSYREVSENKLLNVAHDNFESWLISSAGQQVQKEYDHMRGLSPRGRGLNNTDKIQQKDVNGNLLYDEKTGEPIMTTEYGQYIEDKIENAWDRFSGIAKSYVKSSGNLGNDKSGGISNIVSNDGAGINTTDTAVEDVAKDFGEDYRKNVDMIGVLNEKLENPNIDEKEKTALKDQINILKNDNDELERLNQIADASFAVETKLVESTEEFRKIQNNSDDAINHSEFSDQIQEDLNYKLTDEEKQRVENYINSEVEKLTDEEWTEEFKKGMDELDLGQFKGIVDAAELIQNYMPGTHRVLKELGMTPFQYLQRYVVGNRMRNATNSSNGVMNEGQLHLSERSKLLNEITDTSGTGGITVKNINDNTELERRQAEGRVNYNNGSSENRNEYWSQYDDYEEFLREETILDAATNKRKWKNGANEKDIADDTLRKIEGLYNVVGNDWTDDGEQSSANDKLYDKAEAYRDVAKQYDIEQRLEKSKFIGEENDEGNRILSDDWMNTKARVVGTSEVPYETISKEEKQLLEKDLYRPNDIVDNISVYDNTNGKHYGNTEQLKDEIRKKHGLDALETPVNIIFHDLDFRKRRLKTEQGIPSYRFDMGYTITYTPEDATKATKIEGVTNLTGVIDDVTAGGQTIRNHIISEKEDQTKKLQKKLEDPNASLTERKLALDKINENALEMTMYEDPQFYSQMEQLKIRKDQGTYKYLPEDEGESLTAKVFTTMYDDEGNPNHHRFEIRPNEDGTFDLISTSGEDAWNKNIDESDSYIKPNLTFKEAENLIYQMKLIDLGHMDPPKDEEGE